MKAVIIILLFCVAAVTYSSQPYDGPQNRYQNRLPVSSYRGEPRGYGQSQGYRNGQTYGRQMEYTINGPNERGKMKVTETHVQMDRRMNGQEAEQAMKQIMGSMQDSKSNFKDFAKEIGFHDFAGI